MRKLAVRSFCRKSGTAPGLAGSLLKASAANDHFFGTLKRLDSEEVAQDSQIHNKTLLSLDRDGFFDCNRLEPLQHFVEVFSLDRLGLKWQRKLHRKLLLLFLDTHYPRMLKIAACFQVLDLVKKAPSEVQEMGLYDACMKFLFEQTGLLNLYELMLLYRHGHSVSFLSQEECEFLEQCIGEKLNERGFDRLPEACLVEFCWSLAFQRYRPLYSNLYSSARQELTGQQKDLLSRSVDRLSSFESLKRSYSLRK